MRWRGEEEGEEEGKKYRTDEAKANESNRRRKTMA